MKPLNETDRIRHIGIHQGGHQIVVVPEHVGADTFTGLDAVHKRQQQVFIHRQLIVGLLDNITKAGGEFKMHSPVNFPGP